MGLSSLWPLSSIEMYFSLVPSMDAALTWLTFAARLAWIGNTYLDDSGRDSPASLNSTGDM